MMKSKKGIVLITLFLSLAFFSTACTQKIEEKIGGKIVEKAIEKASGGEVSIDTKDGIKIEMEDGYLISGENLEWPKESMMSLPEPKGNILSITEINKEDATSVILNFEENGGDDYLKQLIDLGYVQQMLNKTEDITTFTGFKDDNTMVMLNYQQNNEGGSIMILRNNENVKEFFETKVEKDEEEPLVIDMDKSMDWPKDAMGSIPPVKAEITNVSLSNEFVSISFEKIGKKDIASYIEKIKSSGFNINAAESEMDNYLSYSATNKEGNTITITWNENVGSIYYVKQ